MESRRIPRTTSALMPIPQEGWGSRAEQATLPATKNYTRLSLVGVISLVVILAVAALVVLANNTTLFGRTPHPARVTQTTQRPVAPAPQVTPQATPTIQAAPDMHACDQLANRRTDLSTMVTNHLVDESIFATLPPLASSTQPSDCAVALSLINTAIADELVKENLYKKDASGRWISKNHAELAAHAQ